MCKEVMLNRERYNLEDQISKSHAEFCREVIMKEIVNELVIAVFSNAYKSNIRVVSSNGYRNFFPRSLETLNHIFYLSCCVDKGKNHYDAIYTVVRNQSKLF